MYGNLFNFLIFSLICISFKKNSRIKKTISGFNCFLSQLGLCESGEKTSGLNWVSMDKNCLKVSLFCFSRVYVNSGENIRLELGFYGFE